MAQRHPGRWPRSLRRPSRSGFFLETVDPIDFEGFDDEIAANHTAILDAFEATYGGELT